MAENERTVVVKHAAELGSAQTRRNFLRALGLGGTIVLLPSVFAACNDDPASPDAIAQFGRPSTTNNTPVTIDLSNDIGIFNFAYALEQLEAAFYTQVVTGSQFTTLFPAAADQEALLDIRNDEVTHRQFIATALGTARIPDLSVDFGANINTRAGILTLARAFENTGVAAYNGAGRFIKNANNLLVAGKIVSVEARHAAALLDIDDAGSTAGTPEATGRRFADLTQLTAFGASDANALDNLLAPAAALANADPYVVTPVSLANVPA